MNQNLQAWLLGFLQSKTAWFGGLLVALPEILPMITPNLQALLSPEQYLRAVQIIGIVVIVLRATTKSSVSDKGRRPVDETKESKENEGEKP
jgi:hypothetical protein